MQEIYDTAVNLGRMLHYGHAAAEMMPPDFKVPRLFRQDRLYLRRLVRGTAPRDQLTGSKK